MIDYCTSVVIAITHMCDALSLEQYIISAPLLNMLVRMFDC